MQRKSLAALPIRIRVDRAAHPGGEGGTGARQLLPAALDTYWQVRRELANDLQPVGLTTSQYLVLVHLAGARRGKGELGAGTRRPARPGNDDGADGRPGPPKLGGAAAVGHGPAAGGRSPDPAGAAPAPAPGPAAGPAVGAGGAEP